MKLYNCDQICIDSFWFFTHIYREVKVSVKDTSLLKSQTYLLNISVDIKMDHFIQFSEAETCSVQLVLSLAQGIKTFLYSKQ